VKVWWHIGLFGFGGPAGQIALMHRIIVDEKRWLDEARFLHALNYCMLLPGLNAAVLAIVIQALLRIAGRALYGVSKLLLVLAGFLGLYAFNIPFPLVVLGAGFIGYLGAGHLNVLPVNRPRSRQSLPFRYTIPGLLP